MQIRLQRFLFILPLLAFGFTLSAQCDRVGQTLGIIPGCGAKIKDLHSGEILWAVEGYQSLVANQVFSFRAENTLSINACPNDGVAKVKLTCLSSALPCKAEFGFYHEDGNPLKYYFEASIYDANNQFCTWNFGDGSAPEKGKIVDHHYEKEGIYEVCLTLTDIFGCQTVKCQKIEAKAPSADGCAFDIKITAVDLKLLGEFVPSPLAFEWSPQNVRWYANKSSQTIGQGQQIVHTLPDYGDYMVCAEATFKNTASNLICTQTRCAPLSVIQDNCIMKQFGNPDQICLDPYIPVCGCDGLTYKNECEAMRAGLTNWWAGPCPMVFGENCRADLEVSITDGSLEGNFKARFHHISSGEFSSAQLDLGDGSPLIDISQKEFFNHIYTSPGIYRVNLTTWKNNGCVSSVTKMLATDATLLQEIVMPEGTDYVMPGDANNDHKADAYDLLNLGVGFYHNGAPRPLADEEWKPQFAPNWDELIAGSINLKHLDCDGNGAVNGLDQDLIEKHYSPIEPSVYIPSVENTPPALRVEFLQDTVTVDTDNPSPLEIQANIILGASDKPVFNIYGLAFAMQYPEYVGHDPVALFDGNPFWGINHNLWLPRDNHERHQFDIGLAKNNGQSVSGYGRIAELTFRSDYIIIIDIIDRADNQPVPFTVPIRGIKAIDGKGYPVDIGTDNVLDTIWIKPVSSLATRVNTPVPELKISPNPAFDEFWISTSNTAVERFEIFNSLGQRILQMNAPEQSGPFKINAAGWPKGIYWIKAFSGNMPVQERKILIR